MPAANQATTATASNADELRHGGPDDSTPVARGWRQALREFLYGLAGYEIAQHALEIRASMETLFMLGVFGDMLGVPILPPYYGLRLLPFVVPQIETWKRRVPARARARQRPRAPPTRSLKGDGHDRARKEGAESGQNIRDTVYGMAAHDMSRAALRTRASMEHLFILITMGDLLGIPILPPYYSLRLLPYVVPQIATWKRRMLREKDVADAMF